MKRQLAIVTRHMITGGVERALIAMLKRIDYSTVDIDLYVEQLGGDLFLEVPSQVQVHSLQSVQPGDFVSHPLCVLRKSWNRFKMKLHRYSYVEQCRLASQMMLPIKKEYDVAISYHAPNTVPVFFVKDKMKARKKILWLHGDLDTNAGETKLLRKYHGQYDQVFAVSKNVWESYVKYHPSKREETHLFYNFVDVEGIRQKAEAGPKFQKDGRQYRVLTIGRLDPQKGLDIAIAACRKLLDRGLELVWYVCGEGAQRRELEQLIEKYKLEGHFILLGNQDNPYGYLQDCDLYVQPSRTEGYCTTTNEARMLSKPVITTDVSGAREQFINGETGWIVPIDEAAIANQMEWCMTHPEECRRVCDNLKDIALDANVQKIKKIFD